MRFCNDFSSIFISALANFFIQVLPFLQQAIKNSAKALEARNKNECRNKDENEKGEENEIENENENQCESESKMENMCKR